MRKLNRTRDFGTFKGAAFQPEGCDRVACYQQDNRLFDSSDREIVPGVSLAAAHEQRRQANEHRAQAAAELLAQADKMPPGLFKSMAKIVLGPGCPAKKADIIAALDARFASYRAAGSAQNDEAGDEDARPVRADRTVPDSRANVDLAAWGCGDKDYAFAELRKAVEERLGISTTDPRAALLALIDNDVVPFEQAREDLLPRAEVEVENQQDA